MKLRVDPERLRAACNTVCQRLLSLRNAQGHWTGKLSASALSTATAVMALHQYRIHNGTEQRNQVNRLIDRGLEWLARAQNSDGGWGDTTLSYSNISTTMLVHAVFHTTGFSLRQPERQAAAERYISTHGGVEAVVARYGKDKTFSVPILTHCALAGLVDWSEVPALPFEQACLPHSLYAAVGMPVVSYALPALIAIGQVRHHFRKPWNPLLTWLREASTPRSLRILRRIQPENGGFLEATPLTSFVLMSLAGKGLVDHPVVARGLKFLIASALEDGSWPIDTNLATWVTTLSVNALRDRLPQPDREPILEWLLGQQYQTVHPYTHAAPGGWGWTNLPGGVPDADDTPGAVLAVQRLAAADQEFAAPVKQARKAGLQWLLGLQNRDGGWPTFCRGWGALPFDRSAADITAHVIRALQSWVDEPPAATESRQEFRDQVEAAIGRGFKYLVKVQREDGSWLPLWFGNQHAPDDINPTYGTAKVLAAYEATGKLDALPALEGLRWLKSNQNDDGGWGGVKGAPSSIEETSLAVEALLAESERGPEVIRGLNWLIARVEAGTFESPAPIGFYFARLWYFEELYPLIYLTGALTRAADFSGDAASSAASR